MDAVVVVQQPFGQDAKIPATRRIARVAAHQQPWFLRMRLPRSVGIWNAHLQDAPVAIDILGDQPLYRLLVIGVTARPGTHQDGMVRQRPFGAVRIDTRTNIERPCVKAARGVRIGAVAAQQRLNEIQARGGCQQLGGVNVAIHPVGRLVLRPPGVATGDDDHVDVAFFVALAYDSQLGQLRICGREGTQVRYQGVIARKARIVDARHGGISFES